MKRHTDLTDGSVMGHVWRMTPPMLVAIFAMMAFNLADTWFVSQLGTEHLAAMGFTFPIVMVVHSLAMGLGLGVSSCVSRAIGARNHDRVQHLATYGLLLAFVVMSLLAAAGLAWLPQLMGLVGAEGETLRLASGYMGVLLYFIPLGALPMVGNNAIRATGDTLRPGIIMSTAAILNVVLDPLLIFGLGPIPAMGMRGAALATGLSRLASLAWALWLMAHRCDLLTTVWTGTRDLLRAWGSILHIGLPSAATNLLMPITMGIVTRFIAEHGEVAVAATAAGQRIEQFTYLLPMAMGSTLVPIIGQNWGAGRADRVREVWATTNVYGVAYALLCLVLSIPLASPAAGLFSEDPSVVRLIARYLHIMLTSALFLHIFVHTGFAFNAIRKPVQASMLTVIRTVFLVVPLTWLGGRLLGLQGVYLGLAAATVLSTLLAMAWFSAVVRPAAANATRAPEEDRLTDEVSPA